MSSEFLRITGISANLTVPTEGVAMYKDGDKWGFTDMTGNRVAEALYDQVKPFNGGYAPVCKNGKWGFIDKNGKQASDFGYDEVFGFVNGISPVCREGRYGFLHDDFITYIPCQYTNVTFFTDGVAGVYDGRAWGFINPGGDMVLPQIYRRAENYNPLYRMIGFSEGLAITLGDAYTFIDTNGDSVITLDNMKPMPFCDGFSTVLSGNYCGLINKKGETILRPGYYSIIFNFNDGMAAVMKDGKWGYIDESRSLKIPLLYDGARTFSDGYTMVKRGDYWYTINKDGQRVNERRYDYAYGFIDGYAYVETGGVLNYVDTAGNNIEGLPGEKQRLHTTYTGPR